MIFTRERHGLIRPALATLLAGAVLVPALAAPGLAEPPRTVAQLILQARHDLSHGDAIAAEAHLDEALDKGAPRQAVAAFMGEALLAEGKPDSARKWLGPRDFAPGSAAIGFRALGRLEQSEGNLAAAGKAFDRAIALTPKNATMWVEIGRLRYAGAQHMLALAASKYALELDPNNVPALVFRGQIVRDRTGLVASLPWFKAALRHAPNNMLALGEYAATLGDLGRTREMLAVTRKMLDLDPDNARAFYLQAVMAARAGKTELARSLLNRTGNSLSDVPGAMLLEGVLEIRAKNYFLAIDALQRLAELQPANAQVRGLLARAMFLAGEYDQVVSTFAAAADREGASSYLQTVVARSYEILGMRDLAAPLLDRATRYRNLSVVPVYEGSKIGSLIGEGRIAQAEAITQRNCADHPGSANNQVLAGDVQLAAGQPDKALIHYRLAARVRMPSSLMTRVVAAYMLEGRKDEARKLVDRFLYENPTSRAAVRLAAWLDGDAGHWRRARLLLEYLRDNGSAHDVALLSDLAIAQLRAGDAKAAEKTARAAYRLQRASPVAAQAWGLSLAALGKDRANAAALLLKARQMMGDTPLLAEGRRLLAAGRHG